MGNQQNAEHNVQFFPGELIFFPPNRSMYIQIQQIKGQNILILELSCLLFKCAMNHSFTMLIFKMESKFFARNSQQKRQVDALCNLPCIIGTLIRAGNEMLFADKQTMIQYESQIKSAHVHYQYTSDIIQINELVLLAEVRPSIGGIDIYNVSPKVLRSDEGSLVNDLWITTQSLDNDKIEVLIRNFTNYFNHYQKGFKLNIGDQLKLGRIRLRVQELCLPDSPGQKKSIDDQKLDKFLSIQADYVNKQQVKLKKISHPPCRFCLSISIQPESPLIKPCNCTGTVAFIHVSCLQEWFKNKIQPQKPNTERDQPEVQNYTWKNLECELCKKQYTCNTFNQQIIKDYFEVDDAKYELFNMTKPQKPYLVLEQLTKDKNMLKGLFIINMNGHKQLKIVLFSQQYVFQGSRLGNQYAYLRYICIKNSLMHYISQRIVLSNRLEFKIWNSRFNQEQNYYSSNSRKNNFSISPNPKVNHCYIVLESIFYFYNYNYSFRSSEKILNKKLEEHMDIINYTRQYLENIAQEQSSERKGTFESKQKSNTITIDSQLQFDNTNKQQGNLTKSLLNNRQSQNISSENVEFYLNNSQFGKSSQEENIKKNYQQFNQSYHFEKNNLLKKNASFENSMEINDEELKDLENSQANKLRDLQNRENNEIEEQYPNENCNYEEINKPNQRKNSWELYIENYQKSQLEKNAIDTDAKFSVAQQFQ